MRLNVERMAGPFPLFEVTPTAAWLSSDTVLLGFGEAVRIEAGLGAERFARAQDQLEVFWGSLEASPVGSPIALAGFTFDERSHGSVLIVPSVTVARRQNQWELITVGEVAPEEFLTARGQQPVPRDRPRFAGSTMPDLVWLEAVAEAIDEIEQGRLEKVVLARDYHLWSKAPFAIRPLLSRLTERFPQCFTFLVDGLIGASPELLIRRSGPKVESVVLAGSAARSSEPTIDRKAAAKLQQSEKDLREHAIAVDSVQPIFEDMCRAWKCRGPDLLTLANVHHLATNLSGEQRGDWSALRWAARLHPTAAVGGAPPDEAIEAIRRLEGMDRGRYSGPVGWVDRNGDGEFAVALRCAQLEGGRARLFAGAGIVAGSLPEEELEETRVKLNAMLEALAQ